MVEFETITAEEVEFGRNNLKPIPFLADGSD